MTISRDITPDSSLLTRDLPLIRVKMTCGGPHVLADDEQFDETQEEPDFFASPTQAGLPNRDILPISTGVPILPGQAAKIVWSSRIPGRPQSWIYKIGTFMISNGGTAWGAADWIVNDIQIGNDSQFMQSGDLPGALFMNRVLNDPHKIGRFVQFKPVRIRMDTIAVTVTYIGPNESGCPFFGAFVGTVIDTADTQM